jgi:hypothetical protein
MIKEYIKSKIKLIENIQLADKFYFKKNKLSDKDKKYILNITNGDHFTKIISDIFYYMKENNLIFRDFIYRNRDLSYNTSLNDYYTEFKYYNKNFLPMKDFDIYKSTDIWKIISYFNQRMYIKYVLSNLPSKAVRNLKDELKIERDLKEMGWLSNNISYLYTQISLLNNKEEHIKNRIINKAFKSSNTVNDILRFFDDKSNFVGDGGFTKKQLEKIIENSNYSFIKYDNNNIVVVSISDPNDLKKIGCNSLWCFTYGENNWNTFINYSYNDTVYVIFDFSKKINDDGFSYTIFKPIIDLDDDYNTDEEDDTSFMYDHFNDPINHSYALKYLINKFGSIEKALDIFNFDD